MQDKSGTCAALARACLALGRRAARCLDVLSSTAVPVVRGAGLETGGRGLTRGIRARLACDSYNSVSAR